MCARASSVLVLALALCASASVFPREGNPCSTGPVQCCNSVQAANSLIDSSYIEGLDIPLSSLTGQVGLTCNSITVIGIGFNKCSGQTVCCENNNFNGVVALGCIPVNVNVASS